MDKNCLNFITILLYSLFLTASAFDPRIVNGQNAEEGEFKFAVSLRRNNAHTCGGTILDANHVLTAAHCVCDDSYPRNPATYAIQYGFTELPGNNSNIIRIANISCPLFSSTLLIWDVAILTLESPGLPTDDNTWEPVTITNNFNTSTAQKGVIIGWGRTTHGGNLSTILQKLEVDIYPDETCNNFGSFKQEHHICFGAAPGSGACNGDSGTALLDNNRIQIGIASFITADCGIANETHPNVYTRVESYYNWILENIDNGVYFDKANFLVITIFAFICVALS